MHNPYSIYLAYTPEQIRQQTHCYIEHDMGMADSGNYCVLNSVDGFVIFSFLRNGEASSVSFWRTVVPVNVGSFYGWYGTPVLIRSTKYWTATTFETDEYFIYVSARFNTLYSPVRYVYVRYR